MEKKRKNKPGAGRPIEAWPPEKVRLLRKLYPKTNNEEAAKKLGVTVSALRNAAVRFGVSKKGWTKKDIDFIKTNFTTLTYDQMADRLEKTRWAVINKARELTEINNSK